MEKPQILVYVEKSLNYSAFDVKWVPKSAKVVALGSHARGTGALQDSLPDDRSQDTSIPDLIVTMAKRHILIDPAQPSTSD
ncbi:WD repeat-containing protein 92 [Chionoecetes opilio]|uniref:WD repeat-containing protein 92 n=1 Tax=Chionoecetes opilio TaxID=41210 RepID=A0A8J5CTA0_CHIOP|nr:WD repeat-containing protein 92 [Chionoecetes opilio]